MGLCDSKVNQPPVEQITVSANLSYNQYNQPNYQQAIPSPQQQKEIEKEEKHIEKDLEKQMKQQQKQQEEQEKKLKKQAEQNEKHEKQVAEDYEKQQKKEAEEKEKREKKDLEELHKRQKKQQEELEHQEKELQIHVRQEIKKLEKELKKHHCQECGGHMNLPCVLFQCQHYIHDACLKQELYDDATIFLQDRIPGHALTLSLLCSACSFIQQRILEEEVRIIEQQRSIRDADPYFEENIIIQDDIMQIQERQIDFIENRNIVRAVEQAYIEEEIRKEEELQIEEDILIDEIVYNNY